ncbi:kinase-like protein [Massarina eburnea CBS 473.64]|uniref:Kinase-like protein n=1 Tax=Massarina eburnea CBS 473.64 TaxID=1395130 RepID=A0A6A6RXS4_9PLEO|nr:kinase-like protein [Massarina eburnea CBS 473.64]
MQHASSSPWRTHANEYAKPQYNLQHTMSMVNLKEEPSWYSRGPSSPTSSSVSSCTSTSRSATPTSNNTNNPWLNIMSSPASSKSSGSPPKQIFKETSERRSVDDPSPNRSPQHQSRSTTPTIAPQPLKPFNPTGLAPMTPPSSSGESFRGEAYPGSPVQNMASPNPYRPNMTAFSPLVNGFINTSLSAQGQSLSGWFYELARRQFVEPAMIRKVWQWTLSNPRLAILLVVCEDVASWRQAAFFDLRDENLPFPEDRLQGIVADPRRVVDEQWRATSKELPQNGSHVDFTSRETVPLQHINLIRTSRGSEKSVDRVRMLGSSEDRILIRKRFVLTRPNQKATLLGQINKFKTYEHRNIAKLLCSYAQPSHVGIISARAQYSLDDYLGLPGTETNRSKLLVDWMFDLSSALEYLHSQAICHRHIRPRKILIDGSRVLFAAFGISGSDRTMVPAAPSPQRHDQMQIIPDQAYIYAAPETFNSRGKRFSDVFSLGCVFLSMMTVAQGESLSLFAQYRSRSSQDPSFHANLDRVVSWRNRLLAITTSGQRNGSVGSGRKARQLKVEADWLQTIEEMIRQKPKERVKIATIVTVYGGGKSMGVRRRSIDGGGLSGQTAPSLGTATVRGSGTTGSGGGANVGSPRQPLHQPELSVFDGYFQQQQPAPRRFEQTGTW